MAAISSNVATTDFLNLLTIQLKNQDPIEPVKQENFIAQLSQFSMLEQLESMNGTFDEVLQSQRLTQGVSMIGKEVEYFIPETQESGSGVVEEFLAQGRDNDVVINGQRIDLEHISGIQI